VELCVTAVTSISATGLRRVVAGAVGRCAASCDPVKSATPIVTAIMNAISLRMPVSL
jgi:hypothetical protein